MSVDLTFLSGASTGDIQCINITITVDIYVEYNETFSVSLTSTDPAVNSVISDATVTIKDDDSMF